MQKNIILIILIVCSTTVFGQRSKIKALRVKGNHYRLYTTEAIPNIRDTVTVSFNITSLSLNISPDDIFTGAFIVSGTDTFMLKEDLHFSNDTLRSSGLVIFPHPVRQFIFYKPHIQQRFYYHFFNSGTTPLIKKKKGLREQQEGCARPATIDQSVWREGLPAPDYTPATSIVEHIIVHHSEGRNDTTTDYTYVVRQIYLYHTDGRGWNDIGYNFLIAQNGNIYEGRDGFGITNEEDVVGAHLCSKNNGTMGICLLGNYETALPTTQSLASLKRLLSWKLYKNQLNPMGILPHPHAYSSLLPQVAGHRDGCSTACPGANLYSVLQFVRPETDTLVHSCGGVLPAPPVTYTTTACSLPSDVVLTATGTFNGFFKWYKAPDTTTVLPNGTDSLLIVSNAQPNDTYYVSAVNATGESSKALVTVTVNEIPLPAIASNGRTGAGTLTLKAGGGEDGNYRWYEDSIGTALPGERNAAIITPVLYASKTYYVALVSGGCESTKVAAHAEISFSIYPNPTDKNIFMSTGNQLIQSLSLTDVQGKKWPLSYHTRADKIEIDISNFPPGMYILSAVTNNNILIKEKVTIQKSL